VNAEQAGGLCPACLMKDALADEGTLARLQCHACQEALPADARFCARCGTAVPAEPAAAGDALRAALDAKLQAQYRIVRLLGHGGMGSVYLARDLALDREVAIKVVKTASSAPEVHDRLRREARTAAKLSHPNIVPLHAFGEVEGMPYFVMGYVRGESLAAKLRREGALPEDEALRILADVADALDHAHRQGVVHRDVKPDNVLLDDESGRALLTDFGVARALGAGETMTAAGAVVGTPAYMSPEQAAGRSDVDGRSDVYSLGVMAFRMLAGRAPFEGKTAADVMAKHLTQDAPPLRTLAPAISDAAAQAIERCLAKDPSRRWADARSLRAALGTKAAAAALPEALEPVQATAFWMAWWLDAAVILAVVLATWRDEFGTVGWAVIGILCTLVAGALVASLRRMASARAAGISWERVRQVACWPPPNFAVWYPRRFRRPGDVWDRLPSLPRFVRTMPAIWVGLGVVMGPLAVIGTSPGYNEWRGLRRDLAELTYRTVLPTSNVAFWLTVLVPAWAAVRARGQGRSGQEELRFVLTEPTARPAFWAQAHIAARLRPVARGEIARRGGDTPHDQLQSILRSADGLSGPLRALGGQAAVAGRQLVEAVELADRELGELVRTLDAGEEERLLAKIGALPAGDSASVRGLLERQLQLVRALQARIDEARDERARKVEMLRTLALQLATLRARAAEAPAEVPPLSERVRALCDEIGRQSMALAEGSRPTVG
jgi:serine/threonine-protein kinase